MFKKSLDRRFTVLFMHTTPVYKYERERALLP